MLHLPRSETGIRTEPPAETDHAEPSHVARYAKAFQDLEDKLSDCANMAKIAAQLLSDSDRQQYPDEVVFAVFHTCNMIEDLKKSYYANYRADGE